MADLKSNLKRGQSLFTRTAKQSVAATSTSSKTSYILAQHKKPSEDGVVVKKHLFKRRIIYFKTSKIKQRLFLLSRMFNYLIKLLLGALKL